VADQRGGGITWTEKTWNPIRGCRRISDECTRCYAEITAGRFCGEGQPYHGLATLTPSGPRWTGVIRMVEDHLEDPLRWTRPQLVFVNSMSDLFYDDLPVADIDRIVLVMALAGRHTFQVLTKRYKRMASYLADPDTPWRLGQLFSSGFPGGPFTKRRAEWFTTVMQRPAPKAQNVAVTWPLPNVWWGFSAGRQDTFDQAMAHLATPKVRAGAAVIWWSAEPLLEAIEPGMHLSALDWAVAGGESQDGCRPMNDAWARTIWTRCADLGVAFHMKQLGGHPNPRKKLHELPPDLQIRDYPRTAKR